jgi:putative FmdB family regulatory protein
MPLYDYECTACNHTFEDYKPINKRHVTQCPKCGGVGRQVICPIHVSKLYPFVTEDFDGTPIEVRSRKHYYELCRKHNVYAKHEFGIGYNISEL